MLTFVGQRDLAERVLACFEKIVAAHSVRDPIFELNLIQARVFVIITSHESLAGVLPAARRAPGLIASIGTARAHFHGGLPLAGALYHAGAFAEAEAISRATLAACRNFGPFWVTPSLALALIGQHREDEALEVLQPSYSTSTPTTLLSAPLRLQDLIVRTVAAFAHSSAGRHLEADRLASELMPEAAPFPGLLTALRSMKCAAALDRGEAAGALVIADEGPAMGDALVVLRLGLSRALALHALGRFDEAREAIRDARDRVFAVRDSIDEPELRARYVEAHDVTHETIAIANEWLA